MRIRTTMTLLSGALVVTAGLLGWQVYNTHRLHQQFSALEQQLQQRQDTTLPALNPLALNPAPMPPTAGAPQSPPLAPPGAPLQTPAPDPLGGDPFDLFFSGSGNMFSGFDQMRQRMEDHMRQLMNGQGGSLFDFDGFGGFGGSALPDTAQPQISMNEGDDAYTVTITLPEGSDVQLDTEVQNGQLNIEGTLTVEQKNEQQGRSFSSVQTQQFARSLPLPDDVDPLGMHSETRDNQVIVTLPKNAS